MRLSDHYIKSIISSFDIISSDFELRLFGSRTDDNKNGGDIDLLLLTEEKIPLQLKWKIRRLLEEKIGEQKIDIINYRFSDNANFKDLILEDSILLCKK